MYKVLLLCRKTVEKLRFKGKSKKNIFFYLGMYLTVDIIYKKKKKLNERVVLTSIGDDA